METGTVKAPAPGLSVGKMLAMIAAAMLITMVVTLWLIKLWLFPGPFKPVTLTLAEEQSLKSKLARIESVENRGQVGGQPRETVAKPTPYSEEGASREIVFSEKELNALIGRNPDLAGKVVIDLADNLISATLLLPTNADTPLLGGQPMRVKAGLTLAYKDGRPVVALRGVSVMGVPMPNAWLGNLKNIDLVKRYGGGGFWQSFADGVEAIEIQDGQARIVLKP